MRLKPVRAVIWSFYVLVAITLSKFSDRNEVRAMLSFSKNSEAEILEISSAKGSVADLCSARGLIGQFELGQRLEASLD